MTLLLFLLGIGLLVRGASRLAGAMGIAPLASSQQAQRGGKVRIGVIRPIELDRLGGPPTTASINISARQLAAPDLPADLSFIVTASGPAPDRIITPSG